MVISGTAAPGGCLKRAHERTAADFERFVLLIPPSILWVSVGMNMSERSQSLVLQISSTTIGTAEPSGMLPRVIRLFLPTGLARIGLLHIPMMIVTIFKKKSIRRNVAAQALRNPLFRKRVVKSKKVYKRLKRVLDYQA